MCKFRIENQNNLCVYFDGDPVLVVLDEWGVVDRDLYENFPSSLVKEKDDPCRETGRDVFGVILDRVEPGFLVTLFAGDWEWYPVDVDAVNDVEGSEPPWVLPSSWGLCDRKSSTWDNNSLNNKFHWLTDWLAPVIECRGVKACIFWVIPAASINSSLSCAFVLPIAIISTNRLQIRLDLRLNNLMRITQHAKN